MGWGEVHGVESFRLIIVVASERDWLIGASNVREFYAAIGVELRSGPGEEVSVRCFARPGWHSHDDRHPSCSVNMISGLYNCHGCGAKGNAYQAALEVGRPEPVARELARSFGLFLENRQVDEPAPRLPTERQIRLWRERLHASPRILERLRELKGWTPRALRRTGVGWDGERIVMPVRQPKNTKDGRTIVRCGVVRYLPGGSPKCLAMPGSKRNLFPAPEVVGRRRPIFLVEGESTAISVWSAGHQAVAVPGASSWRPEWAQRLWGRKIVILPDCDEPGRALAARIGSQVPAARIVDIEPSCHSGYDVGDMIAEAHHEGGIWQMRRVLERLAA